MEGPPRNPKWGPSPRGTPSPIGDPSPTFRKAPVVKIPLVNSWKTLHFRFQTDPPSTRRQMAIPRGADPRKCLWNRYATRAILLPETKGK